MSNLIIKAIVLAVVCFTFSSPLFSQEKITYRDGEETIKAIQDDIASDNIDNVVEELGKLSPNDSLYNSLQVTKAYYLMQLERYDEALTVIDSAMPNAVASSKKDLIINKGISFSGKKDYQSAKENYIKGLEEFPKNQDLLYNLASVYSELNEPQKAAALYKTIIAYNPLYENAHYKLGLLYYNEDKLTQALLCLDMFLLINPDGKSSFSVLNSANGMVSTDNTVTPKNISYSKDDDAFNEMDIILRNRIALQEGFEVPNKINVPFVKQNYAIFSQLDEIKAADGFFANNYLPFLKWIRDNDDFNKFMYTTTYSIENEEYKKIVERQIDDINEFLPKASQKWLDIVGKANFEIDGKEQDISLTYTDGSVNGIGKTENDKFVGTWKLYNSLGGSSGFVKYDSNGQFTGNFERYYESGNLKLKGNYNTGKLSEETYYYENGKVRIIAKYKDEELNGPYKFYSNKGALLQDLNYKDGKLNGKALYYHDVGATATKFELTYQNGKIEGNFKEYYPNGVLASESNYQNGEKTGVEKTYYADSTLKGEFLYTNNEYNGKIKNDHPNGELQSEGSAENGYYNGPWKTYYPNGVLESELFYDEGEFDEAYKSYDIDGKLNSIFIYRSGDLKEYQFFDKDGNIIREERKRGGELQYEGYNAYGIKIAEGTYDIKGGKIGPWKFYSDNGVLTEEGEYNDDAAIETQKLYFESGTKSEQSIYKNDTLTDYYVGYHPNGQMKMQGMFKNAKKHGKWRFYYPDGTLESENYFHKDNLNGKQRYYSVEGIHSGTSTYEFGELVTDIFYDKAKNSLSEIDYTKDSEIKTYHANGKLKSKAGYKNGQYHGVYQTFDYYGNKLTEGNYLNNQPHGKWTYYYASGKKQLEQEYINGTMYGQVKYYNENGTLEDEYTMLNGQVNGINKGYNENGVLISEIEFLNGIPHGKKTFYSEKDGTLQMIRILSNGRLLGYSYLGKDGKEVDMIPLENETGKIVTYFPSGQKAREGSVKNGEFEGGYKSYYKSGQLERSHVNVYGEYDGEVLKYYPNGNLKSKYNYVYGVRQGLSEDFYENGKPQKQVNYKNDVKSGESNYFDEQGQKMKTEYYFNGDIYDVKTY